MAKPPMTNNDGGKTPPKWDGPEDARKKKGAGKYPNYQVRKTRSGHTIIFDDSKDNESVTIQHRGGSMMQFMPDGGVQVVSHNGQYNIVFGENRMKITGASDITVDGDASFKVKGNYNVTCDGDANITTKGDFNLTAKNFNQTVAEHLDVAAGSKTEKVKGSSVSQVHGVAVMTSEQSMTVASTGDSLALGGSADVAIKSGAQTVLEAGGDMSVVSAGTLAHQGTEVHLNTPGKAKTVKQVLNTKPANKAPTEIAT